MPEPLKARNRARLREKDVERIAQEVERGFGVRPWATGAPVDRAETPRGEVLVLQGRIAGIILPGDPERVAPAVRVLLAAKPTRGYVTVDMGAVKFVNNGADIMGPGIVEADPALLPGALVWVRDERNKRPLAVGEALVAGPEMPKQPGKKVKNLHRVGDEFWEWEA